MPRRLAVTILVWLAIAGPDVAIGQGPDSWTRPYPSLDYWEYIGPVSAPFTASVYAVAEVRSRTDVGQRAVYVASFGDQAHDQTNPSIRQVVGPVEIHTQVVEIGELRFVGFDASGLTIEGRTAQVDGKLADCITGSIGANAHIATSRFIGVTLGTVGCGNPLTTVPWAQLRFPLVASYAVRVGRGLKPDLTLPLTFAIADGRLVTRVSGS